MRSTEFFALRCFQTIRLKQASAFFVRMQKLWKLMGRRLTGVDHAAVTARAIENNNERIVKAAPSCSVCFEV